MSSVGKITLKTNKQFNEHQLLHAGMEGARRLQAAMERSQKFQAEECSVTPGGQTRLQDPEN